MKKQYIIAIFAVLLSAFLFTTVGYFIHKEICNNNKPQITQAAPVAQKQNITIVDCPEDKLPERCIKKYDWDKIQKMRPFAQDIAIAILTRQDELKYDNGQHCWGIHKTFWIWTCNGYSHFDLYDNPTGATFNNIERDYLWNLYKKWFDKNYRIYKFEENVTIKIIE